MTAKKHRGLTHRFFHYLHNLPNSDRLLVTLLLSTVVATGLWSILTVSASHTTAVSVAGGMITEGIIGTPRFVNPVLATTRADRDLSTLIYSGVATINERGELVPDLAESIERSDDGLVYTITIRPDVTFHDGTPLTAADVVFTYNLIQNEELKSPLRGNWSNVAVEQIDDHTLTLTLGSAYAPFVENLTTGILPAHLWRTHQLAEIPFSRLNINPIGSGPFKLRDVQTNTQGIITGYQLTSFSEYQPQPHLSVVHIRFYTEPMDVYNALRDGTITSSPDVPLDLLRNLEDDFHVITSALPRLFGVFFNQNRSVSLRDSAVREALDLAIDRTAIVEHVLYGYGMPTHDPVPLGFGTVYLPGASTTTSPYGDTEKAETVLRAGGWQKVNEGHWERTIDNDRVILAITLRTLNDPRFEQTAELIARAWRAIGVEVQIEQYEQADLLRSVIRPRDFEAVLFGIDVSRSVDLYPFWHSSQQTDPGLNIAQYANITADQQLEILRTETDNEQRAEALNILIDTIRTERPALFLYTPSFTYVTTRKQVTGPIPLLGGSHDRWRRVVDWHTEQESLWPLFHSRSIEKDLTQNGND